MLIEGGEFLGSMTYLMIPLTVETMVGRLAGSLRIHSQHSIFQQ